MDRGARRATVYRVAKSQTRLKQLSTPSRLTNNKTKGRGRNSVFLSSQGSVLPYSLFRVTSVSGTNAPFKCSCAQPLSPCGTARSAVTLVLKMNLFQCDWSIREQSQHNTYFAFAYAWFCLQEKHKVNAEAVTSWTEALIRMQNTCMCIHTHTHTLKHIPASSVHCLCQEPYPSTPGITSGNRASTSLGNSQTTLLLPMPTSNPQAFFKVKCDIHCSLWVLLIHLTHIKRCYCFY